MAKGTECIPFNSSTGVGGSAADPAKLEACMYMNRCQKQVGKSVLDSIIYILYIPRAINLLASDILS